MWEIEDCYHSLSMVIELMPRTSTNKNVFSIVYWYGHMIKGWPSYCWIGWCPAVAPQIKCSPYLPTLPSLIGGYHQKQRIWIHTHPEFLPQEKVSTFEIISSFDRINQIGLDIWIFLKTNFSKIYLVWMWGRQVGESVPTTGNG